MQATVKKVFVDKFNNIRQYKIGEIIEVADATRLEDMVNRGLVVATETAKAETPKKNATPKKKKGE